MNFPDSHPERSLKSVARAVQSEAFLIYSNDLIIHQAIDMAAKKEIGSSVISEFESSTRRLAEIIEVLEDDGTSLEKALESFEQGIKLLRKTQKQLQQAEQKVQLLLENGDEPAIRAFEDNE